MAVASDRLTPGGRLLPRPLRPAERVMDIDEILDVLDEGRDMLAERVAEYRDRVIAEVMEGYPPPPPTPDELARTFAVLWALYEYGRHSAAAELKRLGLEVGSDDPGRALTVTATRRRSRLSRTVSAVRTRAALGEIAPKVLGGPWTRITAGLARLAGIIASEAARRRAQGEAGRELAEHLREVPGQRGIATGATAEPFGMGRHDEFAVHEEEVKRWVYTAVLDRSTCGACASMDGVEFDSWEAVEEVMPLGGPNVDCAGGIFCRCQVIPAL